MKFVRLVLVSLFFLSVQSFASERIRVSLKTGSEIRCAVCHDVDAADLSNCPGCSTRVHSVCADSLQRCPTMGCGRRIAGAPQVSVSEVPADVTAHHDPLHERLSDALRRDRLRTKVLAGILALTGAAFITPPLGLHELPPQARVSYSLPSEEGPVKTVKRDDSTDLSVRYPSLDPRDFSPNGYWRTPRGTLHYSDLRVGDRVTWGYFQEGPLHLHSWHVITKIDPSSYAMELHHDNHVSRVNGIPIHTLQWLEASLEHPSFEQRLNAGSHLVYSGKTKEIFNKLTEILEDFYEPAVDLLRKGRSLAFFSDLDYWMYVFHSELDATQREQVAEILQRHCARGNSEEAFLFNNAIKILSGDPNADFRMAMFRLESVIRGR